MNHKKKILKDNKNIKSKDQTIKKNSNKTLTKKKNINDKTNKKVQNKKQTIKKENKNNVKNNVKVNENIMPEIVNDKNNSKSKKKEPKNNLNKKVILLISILGIVLILIIGFSYAYFGYSREGILKNELITGDIYMHYTESKELILENALPRNGADFVLIYRANSVMETEESQTGILGLCETFFTDYGLVFDENSNVTTFCQGIGTVNGENINQFINRESASENFFSVMGEYLINDEIIYQEKEVSYTDIVLNPAIKDESQIEVLSACEHFFSNHEFDEGTNATAFCKGEGTLSGMEIEKYIKQENAPLASLYEEKIILLENKMPYFEFSIDGTNTHDTENIWYEIVLTHGEEHETRKTRIRDDLLSFRLVLVQDDGTEFELIYNNSYVDLENRKIWVDVIPAGMEDVKYTYRLYMWINDKTVIGNTEGVDYNLEEWNDVYASIKVNVFGDLNPKTLDDEGIVVPVYGTDELISKVGTDGLVAINQDGTLYENIDENLNEYEIREYRYSGNDVNNYVYFNCQDSDGEYEYGSLNYDYQNNCELWRIIGVFNDNYGSKRIKIVKNDTLSSDEIVDIYETLEGSFIIENGSTGTVYWNNIDLENNNNDWTRASLGYYLNSYDDGESFSPYGYFSNLRGYTPSLVSSMNYSLGNVSNSSSPIDAYQEEISSTECSSDIIENSNLSACNVWNGNQATWEGLISLLNLSDYGYSFDSSYWNNSINTYYENPEIYETSWMATTMNHTKNEWLLNPSTLSTNHALVWESQGSINAADVKNSYDIRPIIALFYDVIIKYGDGTVDNPYVFYY